MPEINTLKQALTPAAKLYNWNVLSQALQLFNINLDPDTKSLIIGGDREMLIEVMTQLYTAEGFKSPQGTSKRGYKPTQGSDGGLIIENIDDQKSLMDAESCLEFLLLSFCHNFSLKPKQGAGLLAQGYKFLAHIVAKGLKGDFEPVRMWLQEIYTYTNKLTDLIHIELSDGSLHSVMSALKPGILSKDQEVVELTFTLITKLALDLADKYLSNDLWEWFTKDSVLELCIVAIKRLGLSIYHNLLEMLLHIGQNNYLELFTQHLRNAIIEPKEYIELIDEFFQFISESKTASEELVDSGVISFWIEFGNKEAEAGKPNDLRAVAINFIVRCTRYFFSFIEENESLINSVLGLINRCCRDENMIIKTMAISNMFYLLEFLSEKSSSFAPIVYRTLTFLLVENYSNPNMREFIIANFVLLFKMNSGIPIAILIEPFIKRLQVSEIGLEVFDYDFISIIAQYPRLSIKHAILLIDIVGKAYLHDFIYSKAAGVPYTYIASRFIQNEPMQEYLFMFCKYGFNVVINTENMLLKKPSKGQVNLVELAQQRNRILDMISWIIQQWQDALNEKIRENLLQNCHVFYEAAKAHSKAFLAVLGLFGNSLELIEEYENLNYKVALIQEPMEPVKEDPAEEEKALALIPVSNTQSKSSLPKKKGNFPWERAAGDIEKAKKKKQEKDQKIREEEEKMKKNLDFKKKKIKQQLEIRKVEQNVGKPNEAVQVYNEGVVQKLVIIPEEIQLKEFSPSESDQLEAVNLMVLKYSKVFKVFFNKYSGTGFARKVQHNKTGFESHADRKSKLFDGEYIKMMKDHNVIPILLTKTELHTIMRSYNHKIAKQAEQSFVDYEGFKGVFCQLAYFVYSKKHQDYSHLPPVVSIKLLLDHMRQYLKSKGQSTEIFDEPDPGSGDKDVVKSLNKLLIKDPNTQMPDGYKRIVDKDIQIAFCIPECLSITPSYKNSIEILDSLLFSSFGIRLLEPQVEYITSYRAKGVGQKLDKKTEPGIVSSPSQDPLKDNDKNKEKEKKAASSITQTIKLSPSLKFWVAHAPSNDKDIYNECASLLEDILHSVQLNMKQLITRKQKFAVQEEKYELKREKEKMEEDNKKAEDDKKRKIRQQQLLDELNKAKEERQMKLKQEEERKKQEMHMAEAKKRENEEKVRRGREEKARMIQEWNKKRDEELKKAKEDEDAKKRDDAENAKKFEEAKKRNQERLDEILKEKQQKVIEQKNEEAKKAQQEKDQKVKKKLQGLQKLKETQNKDDKNPSKKEETHILLNPEVKSLLSQTSPQLDTVFTYYIGLLGKDMPQDGSLPWQSYDKFCTQFDLYANTQQDQALKIFKFFTKKKSLETLTFDDFKNSLALIANKSKDSLGFEDPAKALAEILSISGLNVTIKDLKAKLKALNKVSTGKKKRGVGANQEKMRKQSLGDEGYEKSDKGGKSDRNRDDTPKVLSPKGIIENVLNKKEEENEGLKGEENDDDYGGGLFD